MRPVGVSNCGRESGCENASVTGKLRLCANELWPWIRIAAGYVTVFVTGKVRLLDALVRRILPVS